MFKRSKFSIQVATKMDYEIGTGFTESNVTQYLAELEEYISNLITYVAFKTPNNDFASIASLSLDTMSKPREKKDAIMIEPPTNYEFNYDKLSIDELQELGLNKLSKEDDNFNTSNLYKKFRSILKKDAFSFTSGPNKNHQP